MYYHLKYLKIHPYKYNSSAHASKWIVVDQFLSQNEYYSLIELYPYSCYT